MCEKLRETVSHPRAAFRNILFPLFIGVLKDPTQNIGRFMDPKYVKWQPISGQTPCSRLCEEAVTRSANIKLVANRFPA